MKAPSLTPIPTPLPQRLRQARATVLPLVVFLSAIVVIACLWQGRISAPTMVGQVDGALANVSSHQVGVLAGLQVARFQKVRAGEFIASVVIADPKLVEASLAVIRSEIEMLRTDLATVIPQKRYAVDHAQLRLGWMKERADLAAAKVNMQLAEIELWRSDELFKDKIIAPSEHDYAKATYDALKEQVAELTRLVAEGDATFKSLSANNPADASQALGDPLLTAIGNQEAKLRLTEAQLSPVTLRAPIDGTVTAVYFRSGEAVTPGQPIITIAADKPTRIIGYFRPPIGGAPKPGATVQIRTRSVRREIGTAQILDIGGQLEALPLALQSGVKLAGVELALPINLSLPPNLEVRPGELVDISLTPTTD